MDTFSEWCRCNCLDLSASKTKELVIDFHRGQLNIPTLKVNGQTIDRMEALGLGVNTIIVLVCPH